MTNLPQTVTNVVICLTELSLGKQSKGKTKRSVTCYSAAYTSQTRDQKRFTISEVAADWHELMIPQRTMRPSIARVSEQSDQRSSMHASHRPNQPQ